MEIIYFINKIILWYFIVVGFCYIALLIGSLSDIFNQFKVFIYGDLNSLMNTEYAVPVTVIIPAYNERDNIFNVIESVFNSTYNNIYAIVINDDSTDNTLALLKAHYQLEETTPMQADVISTSVVRHYFVSKKNPRLVVIDKEHGDGIGDTLNVGLNATVSPFFMTVDADSLIEPQAIQTNVYTLLSRPHTVAVGGGVYLLNGCEYKNGVLTQMRLPKSIVAAFQIGEYLRSFLFGRSGWNIFKGALSYSGTNTLFEKEPVIEAGGYDLNNRAQDAEIIVHLHEIAGRKKTPCRVTFTPASFAWTDVPDSLKSYWKQRVYWQMGLLQSFLKHGRMFLNPRYGITGLFTYPFYMLVEIFGCIVEFTAYAILVICWIFGDLDMTAAILLFLVSWGFLSFITVAVIAINFISFNKYRFLRDEIYMVLLSLFEILGFRQFLIVARVYGTLKYFFRKIFQPHKKHKDV